MIIREKTSLERLGQGEEPVPGTASRVSAIVTEEGSPSEDVEVQLLDSKEKTVLGSGRTDVKGRISFDLDTAYLPVTLRVAPPDGKSADPARHKTISWPMPGGFFSTGLIKTWSWDRSVRFTLGAPVEEELDLKKVLTLKNILIAGGVLLGVYVLWGLVRKEE